MKGNLDENILFGVLRIGDAVVFVSYIPECVSSIRKGLALSHGPTIAAALNVQNLQVSITNARDLSLESIRAAILSKPSFERSQPSSQVMQNLPQPNRPSPSLYKASYNQSEAIEAATHPDVALKSRSNAVQGLPVKQAAAVKSNGAVAAINKSTSFDSLLINVYNPDNGVSRNDYSSILDNAFSNQNCISRTLVVEVPAVQDT